MAARMEDDVLDLIAVHVSTDLLALSVKEVKEINKKLLAVICNSRVYVHILCWVSSAKPVSFLKTIYYL